MAGFNVIVAQPGMITYGTSGPDLIYGTAGDDRIAGLGGNDIVFGFDGLDQLAGGDGDDTLCGGGDNDSLAGGNGHDILTGAGGDDDLAGGTGDDRLLGGSGVDRLSGADGSDSCLSGGEPGDATTSSCDIQGDRVIGQATAPITRDANLAGESSLGDVVADAQLWATSGPSWPAANGGPAVVSFVNAGSIRASIDAGPITLDEAFNVQPLGNPLVTMDITGANIDAVLEQQFQGGVGTLQIPASLTYVWNNAEPAGDRVSDIKINGVPVDPAATYRVTANKFLAGGGDGFTVFATGTSRFVGEPDSAAFSRYIEFLGTVSPGPQNRIARIW